MAENERYILSWTREQEKAFENALATLPEGCNDPWERIAMAVPGKTIEELMHHYELLVHDVHNIVSGLVPLPCYPSLPNQDVGQSNGDSWIRSRRGFREQERRKGIAWTEEEHRLIPTQSH